MDQHIITESLEKNETGSPLNQIIPTKKRCGSLNPYRMHPNDKCYCEKDNHVLEDESARTDQSMIGKTILKCRIK